MRNLLIGIAATAGMLVLTQTANAERVCREVCDGGTCVQKCVEHEDRVIVDRDRGPPPPDRPGIDVHVPGVGIEIGH
jgi:hypothetical protein